MNRPGDETAAAAPSRGDLLVELGVEEMYEYGDLIQEVISEATSAFLEWLNEGWIVAPVPWNFERARVEVNRDWYSPCWIVTFTVDEAPWFGDSINVEVQEIGERALEVHLDGPAFIDEQIICHHNGKDALPEEHWLRPSE